MPLLVGTVLTFLYIESLSNDSRGLVVRSLEIGRETERLIENIDELNRTAQQYVVVRNIEVYSLYTQKHFRLIDILEWLELLHNNCMELQRMLDNMLNFSAWRADPGNLYKERFQIKQLIDSVVRRFRTLLLTHDLEVRVDCSDDADARALIP